MPAVCRTSMYWLKFTGSGERPRRETYERPKPSAVPSKNQDEPSGLFRLVLRNEGSLEVTKDGNDRSHFTGQTPPRSRRYAAASSLRLERLNAFSESWFEESVSFFDVARSRAWVMLRRRAHSAHHRGQLTTYLRVLGHQLYSTYGPTADTGGLFQKWRKSHLQLPRYSCTAFHLKRYEKRQQLRNSN